MTFVQTIKQAFTTATPSTQPVDITPSQFILSDEEFLSFKEVFKARAHAKQIAATDILLYNIVRGKKMDRGFTPVTNPNKLAGGENAYKGMRRLFESKNGLHWALDGFSRGKSPSGTAKAYNLTPEQCAKIVAVLKEG